MELTIFNGETEDLVQLLTGNEWPYHADLEVDANAVRKAIKKGYYADRRETFWIIEAGEKWVFLLLMILMILFRYSIFVWLQKRVVKGLV